MTFRAENMGAISGAHRFNDDGISNPSQIMTLDEIMSTKVNNTKATSSGVPNWYAELYEKIINGTVKSKSEIMNELRALMKKNGVKLSLSEKLKVAAYVFDKSAQETGFDRSSVKSVFNMLMAEKNFESLCIEQMVNPTVLNRGKSPFEEAFGKPGEF